MANATVIKLTNNGGTTLLPITDSAYVQHKQGNWITSAHDIISYTYSLAHPDHNDIQTISYSNGNGITLSGQSGKVDINGSDYIQITGATDTLTISTNARPGTVTGVTITQGDGITVSNSGTAISTSGARTISHASVGALSKTYTSPEGKYFSELQFDKFGHLRTYSTANLPTFTDTNTTVITNGTTDVTANHINSEKIKFAGGTNKFTVSQGGTSFDVSITPSITNNVTGSGLTADKIVLGNGNSTVKTSSKGITTTPPNSSSDDTTVPTSKAVYIAYSAGDAATLSSAKDYADGLVTSAIKFVNTVTAIPAAASHGEAYLIGNSTSLSINGTALEPGDMIIAYNGSDETGGLKWATSNTNWTVSSNDTTLTIGSASLQTIATVGGKAIKAKVGGLANAVTAASNLTANAIVLGGGSKNVTTTTTYYPKQSTSTWGNSDSNIPTELAVGQYIVAQGYLTSSGQSKDFGTVAAGTDLTTTAVSANTTSAVADAAGDTLTIAGGNDWIKTGAVAGTDTIYAYHKLFKSADGSITATASGGTAAWSTDIVKSVTLSYDAAGHISGLTVTSGKAPAQPSTKSLSTSYTFTPAMKYVPYSTTAPDLDATWLGTIGTAGTSTAIGSISGSGTTVAYVKS